MLGLYAVCLATMLALLWSLPFGGWLLVLALVLVSMATLHVGDRNR